MIHDDPLSTPSNPSAMIPSRRRWVFPVLGGVLILIGLIIAVVFIGSRLFVDRLVGNVLENAEIDEDVVSALVPVTSPSQHPADTLGGEVAVSEDGPSITFLVIGSDSREEVPEGFVEDQVYGQRADVIMLVRIDGDQVRVLSIPRDLGVDVDGRFHKVNAAYALGGSALMVKTVSQEFEIPINYYVEVDFYGFAAIVDALGGVNISFPYQARDLKSHLAVPAGTQELNGTTALAYARSRNYEEYRDGEWRSVDGSDLGRIRRQQNLMFAMLGSLKSPTIIFQAENLVRIAASHLTLDATLGRDEIISLVNIARSIDRSDVEVATLPVTSLTNDGVFYLRKKEPEASAAVAFFLGATLPEEQEGSEPATVQVLNGNGSGGQASVWGEFLEDQGFNLLWVGDAASFTFDKTVVRVRPDDLDLGEQVVGLLGFGVVEFSSVGEGVDAVVIVGADALNQT